MKETVRIQTPAKLNLGLKLGRRLATGYHGLNTVFQSVDLTDELIVSTLESAEKQVELSVTGPVSVPADEGNLIVKTYRFLCSQGVELPGLKIKLNKQIPTGAGLGGGSGNAAGLLLWARENLVDFNLDWKLQLEIARELGADIPFFLQGGTARGAGIGEQLLSLPAASGWTVLAVPDFEVSSELAYEEFREKRSATKKYSFNLPEFAGGYSQYFWRHLKLTNDFWPLLVERYPRLNDLREALSSHSDHHGLTGSGSGLYALFEEQESAETALRDLQDNFADIDWFMAELGASISVGKT